MEESVDHANWCYRTEGNCNIVIYNKKLGRVYRMLKVDPCIQWHGDSKKQIHDGDTYMTLNVSYLCVKNLTSTLQFRFSNPQQEPEDYKDLQAHYTMLIQYSACVMDRLYHHYMSVPRMQSVDVRFLRDLALTIEDKRPGKRLGKSLSLCPTVLDIPDFAFLPAPYHSYAMPSFMFELKAGCVARSYGNMVPEKHRSVIPRCNTTNSYCYFCLNKSIHYSNSQKRISRYCPQELFSGNTRRMRKCLTNLLEDINCSRNKLRIFQDGVDITPQLAGVTDIKSIFAPYVSLKTSTNVLKELIDILMGCLTHSKPGSSRRFSVPASSGSGRSNTIDSLKLPEGCVLSAFANAQLYGASTLDEIQGAYDVLKSAIMRDPEIGKLLCIDGPYDTGLWRLSTKPDKPQGVSDHVMSAFIMVRNYLIFRTTKDSSILVTFQPFPNDGTMSEDGEDETVFVVTDSSGYSKYKCKVTVIDFDLKPFSRMEQYLKSEWKIYSGLQKQLLLRYQSDDRQSF